MGDLISLLTSPVILVIWLWMPVTFALVGLFVSSVEPPRYRPNFLATVIIVVAGVFLSSKWRYSNYGIAECLELAQWDWERRADCESRRWSIGLILFWMVLYLPLAVALVHACMVFCIDSYKINRKYGRITALSGTVLNFGRYMARSAFYAVIGLLVAGLLDLFSGGLDADFDLDIDLDTGGTDLGGSGGETLSSGEVSSLASPPLEEVSGYVRHDGVEVESYLRTQADDIPFNNLSHRG